MKKIKYMLYILFLFFLSLNIVNATDEFDADAFCTGPVEGAFSTLGWIFFVLKIVIPIIIIIFGTIDVSKAVVASKDDEIKKSIHTLVKRVIAGIVIFFIPTFLSFIVKLINGEAIYDETSGTFSRCTYCMLNPTDCKGLKGE